MRSRMKITAMAGLLAASLIGGTFAYFTQTDSVKNRFHSGIYETELTERFHPGDGENWEPGARVSKEVWVENTGALPVVVRVKFAEEWESRDDPGNPYYRVDTTDVLRRPEAPDPAARNKFESVYQADPNDGLAGTDVDDSVVVKELNLGEDDRWVYRPEDGYYYYRDILPAYSEGSGEYPATQKLLESVTLADDTDMGRYREVRYYSVTESGTKPAADDPDVWIRFDTDEATGEFVSAREMSRRLREKDPPQTIYFMKSQAEAEEGRPGYRDSDYTLLITAQTVQATDNAVWSLWGLSEGDIRALGCDWPLLSEDGLYSGDEAVGTAEPGEDVQGTGDT